MLFTLKVYNSEIPYEMMSQLSQLSQIKRKLSPQEISQCLDFVLLRKQIPYEIAKAQQENIQSVLRKQLESVELYPSQFPKLKETIERKFLTTQIAAGSMVGALAATSIGEPMTQLVLNSFHSSGISKSNVTTGVPRMKELLNVSSKNKMCGMKLFFKDCDHTDVVHLRNVCKELIEHISLYDLIVSRTITQVSKIKETAEYQSVKSCDWEDWHEYHKLMMSTNFEGSEWCVIFKINKEKLFQTKKSLLDVCTFIDSVSDELCSVASDEENCLVCTYVNVPDLQTIESIEKKKYKNKNEEDVENTDRILITEENKPYYYIRDIILNDVFDLTFSGVDGVTECFFDQPPGSNSVDNKRCWAVNTRGSNFRDILNNPFIDHTRTMTSRLDEIQSVLGIEAARSFLISEFSSIISSSKRHLEQLVNAMTFTGKVRAANRHGIENSVGVMAKMSFEQPLKNAIEASVSNKVDTLSGVSGQLMLGQSSKVGTGFVSVLYKPELDVKKYDLMDSLKSDSKQVEQKDNDYIMKWVKGKGFTKIKRENKEEKKMEEYNNYNKNVTKKRTTVGGSSVKKTFVGIGVTEKNIFKTPGIREKTELKDLKHKENVGVLKQKAKQTEGDNRGKSMITF